MLLDLLKEFRILYLTGPRQAGKTTLVRSLAELTGMEYITLDNQGILASIQNDPYGFVQALGTKKWIIDEFQYAPGLIPLIKASSDQLKPEEKGKYILTGSADIFRSAKAAEALPGHMARVELYPLSISEIYDHPNNMIDYLFAGNFQMLQKPFISRESLAQRLINGGYPEVQTKSIRGKQIWFRSYLEGRLFKDFETLYAARGDYHSKLKALAPYLAGLSGNLLKYASISNDLSLDDKVVKTYIEILELMFIIKRVPSYLNNRSKRHVQNMPKIHMIDTGLACSLLGLQTPEHLSRSQYFGGLLESFIYMELLKQNTWATEPVDLYHFRDRKKNEVDIVMERKNGQIIGVEVKASATITAEDFKGLFNLADFSQKQFQYGILFYSGQEILPFHRDKISLYALPIETLIT